MTRNKTKHTAILDERVRKSTLEKRTASLFKKAQEITTLCDIDMVVIIQDPQDYSEEFWPSREAAEEKLAKFLSIPEVERNKKMTFHEAYLTDRVNAEIEKIIRNQNKNEEKEMAKLLKDIAKGRVMIKELSLRQTDGLSKLVIQRLKRVENRCQQLEEEEKLQQQHQQQLLLQQQDQFPFTSLDFAIPPPITGSEGQGNFGNTSGLDPKLREELMNDQCFMETTYEKLNLAWESDMSIFQFPDPFGGENNMGFDPNVAGTGTGTSGGFNVSFSTPNDQNASSSSGAAKDEEQLPNSGWPYYFLP